MKILDKTTGSNRTAIIGLSTVLLWLIINPLGNIPHNIPTHIGNFFICLSWAVFIVFLDRKNQIFIGINCYLTLLTILLVEKITFQASSLNQIFTYTLLLSIAALVISFTYQQIPKHLFGLASSTASLILLSILILPISILIYTLDSRSILSNDAIYAVLQSNINESTDFVSGFIDTKWLIFLFSLILLIGLIFIRQERNQLQKIKQLHWLILLPTILLSGNIIYSSETHFKLYSYVISTVTNYKNELTIFKHTQAQRNSGQITFKAEKTDHNETYIIVIGESLNKNHMGVYGYHRKTTPNLTLLNSNNDLLTFNQAFANHTHTNQVLSLALTEASQVNNKNYYNSPSIINVLNQAKFDVTWITNQVLYGVWDNLVSVIAHDADLLIPLNTSIGMNTSMQHYDAAVIEKVS